MVALSCTQFALKLCLNAPKAWTFHSHDVTLPAPPVDQRREGIIPYARLHIQHVLPASDQAFPESFPLGNVPTAEHDAR